MTEVITMDTHAVLVARGMEQGNAAAEVVCAHLAQAWAELRTRPTLSRFEAQWRWESDDPVAVKLLLTDAAGLAKWVFSRDLLLAGLAAPVGDGDVVISPWPLPALSSDGQSALAQVRQDADAAARELLLEDLASAGERAITPSALLLWLRVDGVAAGLALPWAAARMLLRASAVQVPFSVEDDLMDEDLEQVTREVLG